MKDVYEGNGDQEMEDLENAGKKKRRKKKLIESDEEEKIEKKFGTRPQFSKVIEFYR